jgi:hypothetical protein
MTPWIKVEHTTPAKREMLLIAEAMNWPTDQAFGTFIRMMIWADANVLADGNAPGVTLALLDRFMGTPGFSAAVASVGWLRETPTGLLFVNFDRHNAQSAKTRALAFNRVKDHRDRVKRGCNDASVTKALLEKEKDLELDSKTNPPNPPTGGTRPGKAAKPVVTPTDPPIPDGLNTPAFQTAWADWIADRKERRKPLTARGARQQLAKLQPLGPDRAVAAIGHSIASGYQGIFEGNDHARSSGNRTAPPAATDPRANSGRQPGGVAAKLTAMFADANAEVARIARESRAAV